MCSLLPVALLSFLFFYLFFLFFFFFILFLRFLASEIKVDEFRKRQEIRVTRNMIDKTIIKSVKGEVKDKTYEIRYRKQSAYGRLDYIFGSQIYPRSSDIAI